MWKSLGKVLTPAIKSQVCLLSPENILQQQLRTTFILKRRNPTQFHRKGQKPKTLRSRHYVYDLVSDTTVEKQPNVDVILTSFVDGLGNAGEKVSVKPQFAYNNLLLPGLAVYASSTNVEMYQDKDHISEVEKHSSATASLTVKTLSRIMLSVIMNKDLPWTLQPWHVKVAFRKCGYIVPEDAITLPEQLIKGPDMSIENKEFYVTVTINNLEKVNVRCRIHHWSTDLKDRIPYVPEFFKESSEPIFPEQKAVLESIPQKHVSQSN